MIEVILGNVGSGKTAYAVREIAMNSGRLKTYSNIITKIKSQVNIDPGMIIKKEIIGVKKNTLTHEKEAVYKYSLNSEFWQKNTEPINVVLDEAHTIINARRSMSKVNVIVTDWIALIRRVLGSVSADYGKLTLISQLDNRIDNIARDMATCVVFVKCHWITECQGCRSWWKENSEMPEHHRECMACGSIMLKKSNFIIEAWKFRSMKHYKLWDDSGRPKLPKIYYRHFYIPDIEKYFPLYNTLQWENMFSAYY